MDRAICPRCIEVEAVGIFGAEDIDLVETLVSAGLDNFDGQAGVTGQCNEVVLIELICVDSRIEFDMSRPIFDQQEIRSNDYLHGSYRRPRTRCYASRR